jgi:hypothetical protein
VLPGNAERLVRRARWPIAHQLSGARLEEFDDSRGSPGPGPGVRAEPNLLACRTCQMDHARRIEGTHRRIDIKSKCRSVFLL